MTIADEARDSAIHCEMVKYAYRQTKDGVVVSFVVHPDDMPTELATARIGSRWIGALVQIGDDEQPVNRKEAMPNFPPRHADTTPQSVPDKPPAAAKRAWEKLQPAQQAGIRGNDSDFEDFLKEEYQEEWAEHQHAADCIRAICGVHSRAELNRPENHRNLVLWRQLDKHFQAWEAKLRLNA